MASFFEMKSFGSIDVGLRRDAEAERFLDAFVADHLDAVGGETHVLRSASQDDLGYVHLRFDQKIQGRRVIGAQLIVHVDASTGEVRGVNGQFVPAKGAISEPTLAAEEALARAIVKAEIGTFELVEKPELVYLPGEAGQPLLAWRGLLSYQSSGEPRLDDLFADAENGAFLALYPRIHTAKHWHTHDAQNTATLPGVLRCVDGGSCNGDTVAQAAHDHTSSAYDYFKKVHGRDSYNAAGATIVSTVRYLVNHNNAYWDGTQMVFGTGDGSRFSHLGSDADIVVHELAHGVTQSEADLIYRDESGALNEAFSDVFAAAATAWRGFGAGSATWQIGESAFTPLVSGDALRYMANPTQDSFSRDYYPTRYMGCQDSGGVHWNSGIANLAFYLLSQGGRHPRNVTTNMVPGIGIGKAERIFYRALATYLVPSSTFLDARNSTSQAAADLYGAGSVEVNAVQNAWCAVGVSTCPPPVNFPPVARFTYTCTGLACDFDASTSTDDRGIVTYAWTFGSLTATGITASPFLPRYGSHSVSLRVTDTDGVSATKTQTITLTAPAVTPATGSWYNPNRSGNGISISRASGNLALAWFTYLPNGTPIWYTTGAGPVNNASWSQPLYKTTWNGSTGTSTQVGTASLVFSNANEAWFSWVLNGVAGGERFQYLFGGAGRTGAWYAPTQSGWGIIVDELNNIASVAVTIFDGAEPRWVLGSGPVSGDMTIPMLWYTGPGLCPGCNPSPPRPTSQPAGSIRLQIPSGGSTSGFVSTSIVMPSGNTWNRTNLPIARLTGP